MEEKINEIANEAIEFYKQANATGIKSRNGWLAMDTTLVITDVNAFETFVHRFFENLSGEEFKKLGRASRMLEYEAEWRGLVKDIKVGIDPMRDIALSIERGCPNGVSALEDNAPF